MSEAERIAKLEAVQMQLFALAAEQNQLRLDFRQLEKKRNRLTAKVRELRSFIKRLQPEQMKKCRKCNVEMLADCFCPDDRYADGRYPYCRYCKSDMGKKAAAA